MASNFAFLHDKFPEFAKLAELAESYGMSEGHFIRSFKSYAGSSPNAFKTAKRLEIASEMLISTKMTVEQVAAASGYADPLYFSRIFNNMMVG